jgi:hypothetical protein
MIVSEKNSESQLIFVECTVAVICQHYCFSQIVMNHMMFLECIIAIICPYCKYSYTHNTMPGPSEEWWWSGGAEGEAFMSCVLIARVWEQ